MEVEPVEVEYIKIEEMSRPWVEEVEEYDKDMSSP